MQQPEKSPDDKCPVNWKNNIPFLSQKKQAGQTHSLSTERENSSIPTGEGENWKYPSPQQMYNALIRKGYNDTPAEDVSSMVDVHNFLNEGAWDEVKKWEGRRGNSNPSLVKFQGRPQEPSPKAKLITMVGRMFPNSRFAIEPPFDRHDWYVQRGKKTVRFVIDFYSAPPDKNGDPVFYLDVRPALDSPIAIFDRLSAWSSSFFNTPS